MEIHDQALMITNGVQVVTTKHVAGYEDSRILFKDGSWCDPTTGELHNEDPKRGGLELISLKG